MKKTKIVITGGPSGGKTTLIETLQMDMKGQLTVVPEAASLLYRGGFPRRPTDQGKINAQKAIYYTQKELEELIETECSTQVIVCDRGSLDSIAYWPSSPEDFLSRVGTTLQKEIERYDWVLHLATADKNYFDTSNPLRPESHREAIELDKKIQSAWANHPRRLIIGHSDEFLEKIAEAKKNLIRILST